MGGQSEVSKTIIFLMSNYLNICNTLACLSATIHFPVLKPVLSLPKPTLTTPFIIKNLINLTDFFTHVPESQWMRTSVFESFGDFKNMSVFMDMC